MRANMDGSNHTIIESYKIFYPTSLRLDLANQHIYWLDKYMDYVERVDYDGKNRWSLKAFVKPLNAIALFEAHIFITKRTGNHREIWRVSRRNSSEMEKIFAIDEQPLELRLFHAQTQPMASNPCTNNSLNCQHLCVLDRIDGIGSPTLRGKCICKAGYQLKSSTECILEKQTSFLIYAKQSPAMIRGISVANDNDNDTAHECMVPILNVKWPLSLDYNAKSEIIYFGQNDM